MPLLNRLAMVDSSKMGLETKLLKSKPTPGTQEHNQARWNRTAGMLLMAVCFVVAAARNQ